MAWDNQQQRIPEMDQATTCRRQNPPKTLEMDWTHPPKASDLYHMPSPDLEPTGKEKAGLPKKHLVPQSGGWNKKDRLHLGTTWEAGPGSGCPESSCGWPMLQHGPNTMMMMITSHERNKDSKLTKKIKIWMYKNVSSGLWNWILQRSLKTKYIVIWSFYVMYITIHHPKACCYRFNLYFTCNMKTTDQLIDWHWKLDNFAHYADDLKKTRKKASEESVRQMSWKKG